MEIKFGDLPKKIKTYLAINSSKKKSNKPSANFYSYKDIPLSVYIAIANTGDLFKLLVSGSASPEALEQAWEQLIKDNNDATGSREYLNYLDDSKEYASLIQKYLLTKTHVMYLLQVMDQKSIDYLNDNGYRIDTTSNQKFVESLNRALKRNENVLNRLRIKANEMALSNKTDGKKAAMTSEQLIAILSYQLGFSVPSNVTLAAYNEYNKKLKKHQPKKPRAHA